MGDFLSKKINAHFAKELPADPSTINVSRQVFKSCFSEVTPIKPSNPEFVHISDAFVRELGLEESDITASIGILSGAENAANFRPYAMCYGGHQFGNWAGQLGDGRAINIAEADFQSVNWKFQLKGAGPTPYSRGADGLAVLRSSVREYLCSEAMHHLGVPTTRALSLVKTGDLVTRDVLYNGNPADEQGAIVCRVSPSFIRFGNFQIFAARNDEETLKTLVDYTIRHHFSHLGTAGEKSTYLNFFKEVSNRTLDMVIHWQRVGFVHGVMNTDNMSILGLTIDYGPYGWLEDYDPEWTPNTTDAQNRRYRYENQPGVALWNLTQLANALYPLIEEAKPFEDILDTFRSDFQVRYHKMMCSKLGLNSETDVSQAFIQNLKTLLEKSELDMTIFFRNLAKEEISEDQFWAAIQEATYLENQMLEANKMDWLEWFKSYKNHLNEVSISEDERLKAMNRTNPKYVLRNYMAQLAIEAAEKGDYKLIDELYQVLLTPYDEQPDGEKWFAKRPDWAKHKVGCSMLSCSS